MTSGKARTEIRIVWSIAAVMLGLVIAVAGIWHWHPEVPDGTCQACNLLHVGIVPHPPLSIRPLLLVVLRIRPVARIPECSTPSFEDVLSRAPPSPVCGG
jgi:hypothetical protein